MAEYGGGEEVVLPSDALSTLEAVCVTKLFHRQADAKHIAGLSPDVALALVAEVRELRAKVERVRAEVDAEVQRAQHRPGESKPDAIRRSMSRAITGRIIDALGEEV